MSEANEQRQFGFGSSHCSTSFDSRGMLDKMRELRAEMAKHPNGFVMTTRTLVRLRDATVEAQESQFALGAMPGAFMGTPIEDYATVKECMDRMMDQRDGERLQLVMSEDIPVECISHPWMKQQVNAMAERFGFGIAKGMTS